MSSSFGKDRLVTVAFDLTLPGERILHAPIQEILEMMHDKKGEFILIIHH